MEMHEKEMLGQDPFGQEAKYIAGLYRRGLVNVKPWVTEKGKYYMGFFLTDAGKEYLEKSQNRVWVFPYLVINKKARLKKDWPLLTYEKHLRQTY